MLFADDDKEIGGDQYSFPRFPCLIAGPTGVGKSLFAVELACRIGGEIIGADAFQIYKGLAVLTAQPSEALQQRVRHHLVGSLPVTEAFDAAKFVACASALVSQITDAGRIPILCGGTGLYLKAFTHGLDPTPPQNQALREALNQLSISELRDKLLALDPGAESVVDLRNPRRVIRAIEICMLTGQSIRALRKRWDTPPRAHIGFFLVRDREDLRARIGNNVSALFEQGAIEEVAQTRAIVYSNARNAIGFKLIEAMLDGQISREDCIQRCIDATWQYAKRQLTWFRNQTNFTEVNMTRFSTIQKAVDYAAGIIGHGKEVAGKE